MGVLMSFGGFIGREVSMSLFICVVIQVKFTARLSGVGMCTTKDLFPLFVGVSWQGRY